MLVTEGKKKRLIYFSEWIIDPDEISRAERNDRIARGFGPAKQSVVVHFVDHKEPLMLYGVTMEEFTEAVKNAYA